MNEEEREAQVRKVIAEIAKLSEDANVERDADVYRDLGIKSINALDLLLTLEETFDITISDEDFGAARTVASLNALVGRLTGQFLASESQAQ